MIKKVLTYSVVVTTLVWSIGLLATPLAASAAVSGDLIKLQCAAGAGLTDPCRAVYYLGANSKRYVFPNEKTYKTWYADFSGVQIVSATELASYAIGGNVTYRPGVKLVKVTTDPTVYAVAANGVLRKISSEAVASELYGTAWATLVSDVPDSFYTNYTPGADITVATDYDKASVLADATSINVDKGLSGGGTGPVSTGTSLKVEKAADTPASGIVLGNTARNAFTKVNLTASADGDIIIDALTVNRTGLGQDGAFAGIDILDAATGLPLNRISKTLNSDHNAVFGDDITVKAGTTLTIILAGNMNALANFAGEAPILALSAVALKGGSVVGTLPVAGNYQQLNGTITVGGATLSLGAYSNATQAALEVGYEQYAFMSLKIDNSTNVEDEQISSLTVYQKGSASLSDDLANFKLYKDGTLIGTGVVSSSDKVSFSFAPLTILKGQNVQLVVKADVVGGSGRTVQLGIYDYADAMVKGLVYNANILPSLGVAVDNANYFATQPYFVDNQATISKGTLTVGQSNLVPTGNIAILPDQKIGAFLFTVKGEQFNGTSLKLKINTTTAAGLTDKAVKSIKIVDANGVSIAGPEDAVYTTGTFVTFTSLESLPVGENVLYVVANVATNAGLATDDKIWVSINNPSTDIVGKGDVTNLSIAPLLTSAVTGYTQTVKAANLTVTRNAIPTNGTAIIKSNNVLLGSWHFDASNSGEDVRLTSLKLKTSSTAAIKQLAIKDGDTLLANKVDISTATTIAAPSTTTFALYTPLVIAKGTSKDVKLYGNIDTTGKAGEVVAFGVVEAADVTASGVTTGNTATVTVVASHGAQITMTAAAALSIEKQGSATVLRTVGGTTALKLGEWLLKATNEALDITKLRLNTVDASTNVASTYTGDNTMLSMLYLKLDGAIIGNAGGYNSVAGTGLDVSLNTGVLRIPYDTVGKTLGLYADVTPMGPGSNTFYNAAFKVGFWGVDEFTATGIESGNAATITIGNSGADATTTPMIVNKAMPIVTAEAFATGEKASSGILGRIKITASGGAVGIYRMTFVTQTTSAQIDLSNGALWLLSCSNGACNIGAGQQLSNTVAAGTDYAVGLKRWEFLVLGGGTHGLRYLNIPSGASAVVEFRAVVTGSGNPTTGNVLTSLLGDNPTSTSAKTVTNVGNTQGNVAAAYVPYSANGNLVWTDFCNPTSGTGNADLLPQWYNGYALTSAAYTPLAATSSSQNLAY